MSDYPAYHYGGIIRPTDGGRPEVQVHIAIVECVIARRKGADGAIVCVRADQAHRDLCRHDPVAFTTEVDSLVGRLRDNAHAMRGR